MRKPQQLLNFCVLLIVFITFKRVEAAEPSNTWIHAWISALDLSKKRTDYREAIEAYTAAIQVLDEKQLSKRLFLFNERGKLYLKLLDYHRAINDFSYVIENKETSQDEILDALWGRGQAYLAIGKRDEFDRDRLQMDKIEPFATLLEENHEFIILKLGHHSRRDTQNRDRFVKGLLMQGKIKQSNDVVFTESGIAIVKKAENQYRGVK